MKIHLAGFEPNRIGGGWTFTNNFANGMMEHISGYGHSDIYFIPGATMVSREEVLIAKKDGKKIVLRLDNALRNSNNRGTGMSRMKDFCELADLVIYQSEWAKRFLMPFTKKDGAVILNGVDTTTYTNAGRDPEDETYLYARSSRDEGKGWIMAWYWFVNNPDRLDIVGKFSKENSEYNFDFYNDERFTFYGQVEDMQPFYSRNKYFLYTYLNDACSNTLLEAIASGCEIVDVYGMLKTGGAPEIMACKDISLERMCNQYKLELERL